MDVLVEEEGSFPSFTHVITVVENDGAIRVRANSPLVPSKTLSAVWLNCLLDRDERFEAIDLVCNFTFDSFTRLDLFDLAVKAFTA
jgi:hypothetical protein